MKPASLILALVLPLAAAEEQDLASRIAEHQEGARKLSEQQDELAADVQQLIIEQTHPKVIELLEGVEEAMDEASGLLLEHDTGGGTIAAETDVIEKIFEAAKERQAQSPGAGQGSAMLEMMQRMMGKEPGGEKKDKGGEQAGDSGGEGQTGLSDTGNSASGGAGGGKAEERRIPKASGTAGQSLPREFQDALDAYNRAAEKLAK